MDVERMTLTYADIGALMRDLKRLGARNALTARTRGLTGRRRFAAVAEAYERERRDGRLPATYEVVHGHAWVGAKAQRQFDTGDGVAIPLAAIGGRRSVSQQAVGAPR
jgi:malonyl-CoA O-methyltransferase